MTYHRLAFHTWPAAVYAIGDVHGCFEQMLALEAAIAQDGLSVDGEKWLVTMGDHIDRGPASAQVIAHIMGPPPPGFRRFSLMGNHEAMLLDFLSDPPAHAYYLDEGGVATLRSYGIEVAPRRLFDLNDGWRLRDAAARFPWDVAAFLAERPLHLSLPGWLFVHAGIRPGVSIADQTDDDLLWIRSPFLTSQLTGGLRVVHGHTPGPSVVVTPHRICVDTACFDSGTLSAVRITPDGRTRFFAVGAGVTHKRAPGIPSRG